MRVALLILAWLAGCGTAGDPQPEAPPPALPAAYAAALQRADAAIDAAAARPGSQMDLERLAAAHVARARAVGCCDDQAAAERALAGAFAVAPPGAGPHLARARLNLHLHRIDRVQSDLDAAAGAVLIDDPTRAEIDRLRGELALQRGDYAGAEAALDRALDLERSISALASMANYRWKTGDLDAARALYREADGRYHALDPQPRAWLATQLGILALERGDAEAALVELDRAHAAGYAPSLAWRAQALVALGRAPEAEALYRAALEGPTPQRDPELMVAWADLLTAAQRFDEAARWLARAGAVWGAQMAQYPEAAGGHALRHALDHGDPQAALALARADADARPYGEPLLLLAEALHRAGRDDEARAVLAQVQGSPWRTPDLENLTEALIQRPLADVDHHETSPGEAPPTGVRP